MQMNRLFEMVYLLLDKKKLTARELAAHFEVSPRTVYRDVELLSSAGIPIYMSRGKCGGIALLPTFILNKTVLSEREKVEILSALHALDCVSLEKTTTAIQKLSSLFGKLDSDWVEVDFSGWGDAQQESALFSSIKTAILEKKIIQIRYYGEGYSTKRVVEPLKLCFKGQGWYLYGFCRKRSDFRFFKLRRIKEFTILEELFDRQRPEKIFNGHNIFQDDLVNLTLILSKQMAYRVYDEFTKYEILSNGDFKVELQMPRGEWIGHYLFTFGEHCEVVDPMDIRLQMKEKLQNMLGNYF